MTTTAPSRGTISSTSAQENIEAPPIDLPTTPRDVLDDLMHAIEDYPHEHLTVSIVEVDPAVGDALNQREEATFRVEVANSGPLNVDDLTVLVEGLNGTTVKTGGAADLTFRASFVSGVFDQIQAHAASSPTSHPGSDFQLKAPNRVLPVTDLLRVSVKDWNTKLDHITDGHSDPDPSARAVFSAEVVDR